MTRSCSSGVSVRIALSSSVIAVGRADDVLEVSLTVSLCYGEVSHSATPPAPGVGVCGTLVCAVKTYGLAHMRG